MPENILEGGGYTGDCHFRSYSALPCASIPALFSKGEENHTKGKITLSSVLCNSIPFQRKPEQCWKWRIATPHYLVWCLLKVILQEGKQCNSVCITYRVQLSSPSYLVGGGSDESQMNSSQCVIFPSAGEQGPSSM